MIHVIQDWNAEDHKDLLEQMFRMRARVFGERLQWDVDWRTGSERDSLDGASPAYLVSTGTGGVVNGACRLLPTSGPTLLSQCFADTMPDAAQISDPSIWECTRFCVDDEACAPFVRGIGFITLGLVRAAIGLARANGIETIIANVNAATIRMCGRAGVPVDILGVSHRFSPAVYLGSFSIARCGAMLDRAPAPAADGARRGYRFGAADAGQRALPSQQSLPLQKVS